MQANFVSMQANFVSMQVLVDYQAVKCLYQLEKMSFFDKSFCVMDQRLYILRAPCWC